MMSSSRQAHQRSLGLPLSSFPMQSTNCFISDYIDNLVIETGPPHSPNQYNFMTNVFLIHLLS